MAPKPILRRLQSITLTVALGCCPLASDAQEVPTNAEGFKERSPGQHGVNRRVAIDTSAHPDVIGYKSISAYFNCVANATQDPAITNPGRLLNKPSYYFGMRGPGWEWVKTVPAKEGPPPTEEVPGEWVQRANIEVDAGLEYDTRNAHRGWRAFISVNESQVDKQTATGPWRGQAENYYLKLNVDESGNIHLQVTGADANFILTFQYSDPLATVTPDHTPYDGTEKNLLGLKRVIANTRPDPAQSGQDEEYNYHLDGTRINCTTSQCHVEYWRRNIPPWGGENVSASSDFVPILGGRTGYDVPEDLYDRPQVPRAPTAAEDRPSLRSRYVVDFRNLTGATVIPGTGLFNIGKDQGAQSASLTQSNVSRYTTETVRINLDFIGSGAGLLFFPRGRTRNP